MGGGRDVQLPPGTAGTLLTSGTAVRQRLIALMDRFDVHTWAEPIREHRPRRRALPMSSWRSSTRRPVLPVSTVVTGGAVGDEEQLALARAHLPLDEAGTDQAHRRDAAQRDGEVRDDGSAAE